MSPTLEQKTAPAINIGASEVSPAAMPPTVEPPATPGPVTENEAIRIVQSWVAEDTAYGKYRTVEEMVENLLDVISFRRENYGQDSQISAHQINQIVALYAPDAPRRVPSAISNDAPSAHPYPPELAALVKSGVARFEDGVWLAPRCLNCGQAKTECCGVTSLRLLLRDDEKTLTSFGRQAVGLDPIERPKPPKTHQQLIEERKQTWNEQAWWHQFRGVGELEGSESVKMYIENFLPEGATLICGLPKEGKSFLALSVAKALTSGRPLFGRRGFEVPEIVPVLYLAAESGDGGLKLRCKKFGITEDKTKFIARTLSQGPMLGLNDHVLEALVKEMRPVVVLETLIRFNDGNDEDDATENRKLAESIFHLIALGARAVIGIHHSRKDLNKGNPTKESAVRGSGDGLAMVDAVWLVMQDDKLFQGGKGPNEVDVVGWGRDFNPRPIRLALTKKADVQPGIISYAPGIVSCIDAGDFEWIDRQIRQNRTEELDQLVEELVTESPAITLTDLMTKTERKQWAVRKALGRLGYQRGRGGDTTKRQWSKKAA